LSRKRLRHVENQFAEQCRIGFAKLQLIGLVPQEVV
jgi:hypothetical protein